MVDDLVVATDKYEQPRILSIFSNLEFPNFLSGMIIQWPFFFFNHIFSPVTVF